MPHKKGQHEDWPGQTMVAEAVVTAMQTVLEKVGRKGEAACLPGCGPRGACHPNLNVEARMLALYVEAITEANLGSK